MISFGETSEICVTSTHRVVKFVSRRPIVEEKDHLREKCYDEAVLYSN